MRSVAVQKLFFTICALFAITAMVLVAGIVLTSIVKGSSQFSIEFFTQGASGFNDTGIFFQIVGTLTLLTTTMIIAAPSATALLIVDHTLTSNRLRRWLQTILHIANATPSILFGILGFIFFVQVLGWQKSWLAGGIILALMILPTTAVSVISRGRTIPSDYLETARGLGLTEDKLILKVMLPYSLGGGY